MQSSKTVVETKEELFLFNPATFRLPEGEELGLRRQENFVQSSALVLDFDNGCLSPEAFEDICDPPKVSRSERPLSFLICNTFNRSPEQPNRFRVVVFYSEPANSIRAHQGVHEEIVRQLEAAGYSKDMTGLDTGCRSGVQSFWMPSTNRAYPDAWFFRCHNTKTHELKRHAINPNDYAVLDNIAPEEAMDEPRRREPVTPEMIEGLLAPIRSMREGREDIARKAFLTMYYRYGMSFAEIKVYWNTLGRDASIRRKFDRNVALVRRNEKTGYVFRG